MDRKTNRKKGGRNALIVLCCVLSVILALLAVFAVVLSNLYGKINRAPEDDYTLSQEEAHRLEQEQIAEEGGNPSAPEKNENDIIWDNDPSHIVGNQEDLVNILLIGQDRRPGEGRARSDSMILCTFNKKNETITMTSFMRDMYVQIPGYEDSRINVAYALGGMELLNECLRINFGIHVDGNIEVDFNGFEEVVNALGGVDINLTESEANYLNGNTSWGDDNGDWNLTEGMNHLTGAQALSYSRIRALDSDFNRTNRQRNVLTALMESCKTMSADSLMKLVNTLLPLVTTDLTNAEITRYAATLIPMLAKAELQTQRIPVDDGYEFATIRGMSVLIPYLDRNRQFLIDTLSPDALD